MSDEPTPARSGTFARLVALAAAITRWRKRALARPKRSLRKQQSVQQQRRSSFRQRVFGPDHEERSQSKKCSRAQTVEMDEVWGTKADATIVQVHHPPSFTRRLAFNDTPTNSPAYSFYNDYRSNLLAKVATVTILVVTALLFIIFAVKNKQIDQLTKEIYDKLAETERKERLEALGRPRQMLDMPQTYLLRVSWNGSLTANYSE